MTCAYAVISPPPPGQLQLGFTLPAEHLTGDFYAAVPVPTAAQGSAQIRLVNGSNQTVADVLPDGLIEGSVIDSFEKMDAYNATLAFLANNRALPADPVLAGYSLLQPLPPGTAPVPVVPPPPLQALPIIWEAPDDPDGGINTHDCFGHWFEVPVPQCEVQRAGTIVVEASMNNFATDAGQAPEDVTATDFVRYESRAHGGMCGPATPSGGCQDPGFPHDCGAVCCPPDNPFYCEATNLCYALEQEALTACEGMSCLGCAARGAGGGGAGDGGGDGTGQIRVKVVTTQSEDPNDEIGEPLSDVHVLIGSTDVAIGGENVARTTVAPGTYVVKYPSDNGLNAEDGTPLDRVGFVNVHVTKESGPGTRCAPTSQEGDVTVTFDPSAANPEAESEYEIGIRIVPFDAPALEGGVTCQ
jgi:hypothetical protein